MSNVWVGGNYKVGRRIGRGSFGEIYRGVDVLTGIQVAIKVESIRKRNPHLLHESKLYRLLQGLRGVPHIYWYGVEGEYSILVMDLLGPSIDDLFEQAQQHFSIKTSVLIGYHMVSRLEVVHAQGIVHRDIKPHNFTIGRCDRDTPDDGTKLIYIIDFGLSKKFRDSRHSHMPYRDGRNLTGTARYVSINTHLGIEPSRRDDLESCIYVLLYFLRGDLPWQGLRAATKKEKYERIMEKKIKTPVDALCAKLPKEVGECLTYCRGLRFTEKPDYAYVKSKLSAILLRRNLSLDNNFDWHSSSFPQLTSTSQISGATGPANLLPGPHNAAAPPPLAHLQPPTLVTAPLATTTDPNVTGPHTMSQMIPPGPRVPPGALQSRALAVADEATPRTVAASAFRQGGLVEAADDGPGGREEFSSLQLNDGRDNTQHAAGATGAGNRCSTFRGGRREDKRDPADENSRQGNNSDGRQGGEAGGAGDGALQPSRGPLISATAVSGSNGGGDDVHHGGGGAGRGGGGEASATAVSSSSPLAEQLTALREGGETAFWTSSRAQTTLSNSGPFLTTPGSRLHAASGVAHRSSTAGPPTTQADLPPVLHPSNHFIGRTHLALQGNLVLPQGGADSVRRDGTHAASSGVAALSPQSLPRQMLHQSHYFDNTNGSDSPLNQGHNELNRLNSASHQQAGISMSTAGRGGTGTHRHQDSTDPPDAGGALRGHPMGGGGSPPMERALNTMQTGGRPRVGFLRHKIQNAASPSSPPPGQVGTTASAATSSTAPGSRATPGAGTTTGTNTTPLSPAGSPTSPVSLTSLNYEGERAAGSTRPPPSSRAGAPPDCTPPAPAPQRDRSASATSPKAASMAWSAASAMAAYLGLRKRRGAGVSGATTTTPKHGGSPSPSMVDATTEGGEATSSHQMAAYGETGESTVPRSKTPSPKGGAVQELDAVGVSNQLPVTLPDGTMQAGKRGGQLTDDL